MNVEVMISTMHQKDYSLLEKIGLRSNAVVINQCNNDERKVITYNGHRVLWINSKERGLSRSRNMALENATGDICLLVDEDEILSDEYVSIIQNAFQRNLEASVIGFQVCGIEGIFKIYKNESEKKVGYVRSMRMASVELAFRRIDVLEKEIKFNILIGAGTKYCMGEENTFLFDCMNNGLKVFYVPEIIGRVHLGESTWFKGFTREYFFARGAVFAAMSKKYSIALILQFIIRKIRLYRKEIRPDVALKCMLSGRKEYLGQCKGEK